MLAPVFLDAPHVLSPVDLAESFNTPEELGAPEAVESDPALQPRGWWKVDRSRTKMTGLEDSLALLRDTLKKDHYDVGPFYNFTYEVLTSVLGCVWLQVRRLKQSSVQFY